MKKLLPKPVLSSVIIVLSALMLLIPVLQNDLLAQDVSTACMEAERQAQSDISGGTWFVIGCLAGLIGYLIAMQEPNPPATPLLGKSPEYVAAYTDCYRKKGKSIKTKNALTGCLVGTGISVVFYAIAIAAASNETDALGY